MAKRERTRPTPADLTALQKVAAFMERTRLNTYIDLLNSPWRLVWLNFLAGLARGVGLLIGGGIVGTVVILILIRVLRETVTTLGGLPWIGKQLEEMIAWILTVVEQQQRKP